MCKENWKYALLVCYSIRNNIHDVVIRLGGLTKLLINGTLNHSSQLHGNFRCRIVYLCNLVKRGGGSFSLAKLDSKDFCDVGLKRCSPAQARSALVGELTSYQDHSGKVLWYS